jgi:phosphotransacetylase
MIDGEMQADTAVAPQILEETYPFSTLKGGANVLIFPNLEAGNIAYKADRRLRADRAAAHGLEQAGARAAARVGS